MSFTRNKKQVEMLRKSVEAVGHLQDTIREKGTQRILVGRHRKLADPDWPEREIKIKDDLHRELVILHGNIQRGIPDVEGAARLERVAKILVSHHVEKDKVCSYIVENGLVPWSQRRVEQLLPKEYKLKGRGPKPPNRNVSIQPGIKRKTETIKTALQNLTTTVIDEPSYPYPDCKCSTCPHRKQCY